MKLESTSFVRERLHRRQSDQLNMFRAGAALVVVLGHVRGLFFVSWSQVQSPNVVYRAFYLVTSLGHQAVMVFFVLSGYLVGSNVLRTGMKNWSWRWYLNRRLTRLWIVLIPALMLCAVLDHVGISVFGLHGIYGNGNNTHGIVTGSVQQRSTVPIFFGNVAFLQGIRVPTFGTDGALWSLPFEFCYYLLFPLVLLVFAGKSLTSTVVSAIVACSICVFVGPTITLYFLVWLFGVLIVITPNIKLLRSRFVWQACMIVSLAACAAWMPLVHSIGTEPSDFVTGALFTVAIFLIVRAPRRNSDDRGTRKGALATRMALFSYTLYLVHLPALVLIRAGLQHHGIGLWQPSPVHLAIATAVTAAVVIFAWAVSLITEQQTDRVRLLIGRVIREPGASPAASTRAAAPAHD